MNKRKFIYYTRLGHKISLDHYPGEGPTVIYVHGFKGFKDWGFVPHLSNRLAESGFNVLTFNFSHNGIGEDELNFTEEEKFGENTFSLEKAELLEIIDLARNRGFWDQNPQSEIALLGHSRGGGIALLAAALHESVKAVVTWASLATFARYSEEQVKNWREMGFLPVKNSRTGQVFKMKTDILDDFISKRDDELNILKAVSEMDIPLCVIHGEEDLAVSPDDARNLFDKAEHNYSELHIHPGTGHTFGAKHPFEGSNETLDKVIHQSIQFLNTHLKPQSK